METAQTVPEWKAVADEIWAILRDTNRIVKENTQQMKETDRQMKETDRQMKETDRQVKETARQLGKLGNRFGEMVEYMVTPNLVKKFHELGFEFEKTQRDIEIKDPKHNIFAEVDVFLENGDKVMIVEIKSKVKIDDVGDHIERMEKLCKYANLHDDKRKYLGAIAGVVFGDYEKKYTLKKGFYVIEPSGDTFNITAP